MEFGMYEYTTLLGTDGNEVVILVKAKEEDYFFHVIVKNFEEMRRVTAAIERMPKLEDLTNMLLVMHREWGLGLSGM